MPTVGCAGILVADMFCGPMAQLPGEGELLSIDDMPLSAGGCAANVAIDLARQDIDVDIAGCVGSDGLAEGVVAQLRQMKVGCGRIIRSDRLPTSKTVILVGAGQDRRYIHAFGANAAFRVGDIDTAWATSLKVLYVGGLFAMPGVEVEELAGLLATCRRAGVVTVVDVVVPAGAGRLPALGGLLPQVDYFLPNTDEARVFTGLTDPFEQIAALQAGGARTVIVTDGSAGSCAGDAKRRWRAEAYRCEAVDPSGSGDAFAAGVITGIVHGWDLPAMLRYGGALGASAARAVGTTGSVFRPEEARAFMAANPDGVREVPWN